MEVEWLYGIIGSLFAAGAMAWAKNVSGTLKEMNDSLKDIAHFKGRVETHMEDTDRRIDRLENRVIQH